MLHKEQLIHRNTYLKGHLAAFITIFIWGTTFISTKILLQDFTPSALVLKEQITPTAVCGILLTLTGLFLSEGKKIKEVSLLE